MANNTAFLVGKHCNKIGGEQKKTRHFLPKTICIYNIYIYIFLNYSTTGRMKTDANHDSCRNCRFSPGKPLETNRATCWSFDDILVASGGSEWKNILNERNH